MTSRSGIYLASALALLAGLAGYFAMAFANLLVWDSRPAFPYLAALTGLPWWWPNAPQRFFLYNQPVWGAGGAVAFALIWRWQRGNLRWLRVGMLWAAMLAAIGLLGLMVRDSLISGTRAAAAALWLYGLIGMFAVRDWVVRP